MGDTETTIAVYRCDCCWRDFDDDNQPLITGILKMPQRREFRVCQECVNYMWHGRSPHAE